MTIHAAPTDQYLKHRFAHHPPRTPDTIKRHTRVRDAALAFAKDLCDHCPPGPELDRAIEAAELAMMQANAGIARAGALAEPNGQQIGQTPPGFSTAARAEDRMSPPRGPLGVVD